MESIIENYEKQKIEVYNMSIKFRDENNKLRLQEIDLFHALTEHLFTDMLDENSIVSLGTIYLYKVKYIGVTKESWNNFQYQPVIKLLRVNKQTFDPLHQDHIDFSREIDVRRIKEVLRFGKNTEPEGNGIKSINP